MHIAILCHFELIHGFNLSVYDASFSEPDAYLIVRACVVDNGAVNSEMEIGRIDHCGLMDYVQFDNVRYRGCILSCNTDGCNHAAVTKHHHILVTLCLAIVASLFRFRFDGAL